MIEQLNYFTLPPMATHVTSRLHWLLVCARQTTENSIESIEYLFICKEPLHVLCLFLVPAIHRAYSH